MTNYIVSCGNVFYSDNSGWDNQEYSIETLTDALHKFNGIFESNIEDRKHKWAKIVCQKTNTIIKSRKEIDINKYVCHYDEYEFN
jgi:hypothetical protein